MKCLAECAKHPEVAGLCWSASDYEFMVAGVCGTANATGTGGTSSTIGSAGGSSSRGGATGTANVAGVAGVGGSSALSAQGGALSVGGSTVAGGASNSGTSGNSSTGIGGLLNTGGNASGTTALGASCGGPCNGTFCRSSGSAISLVCTTSDASAPCIGTETGMYCTHTCSSDADCAPASRDMKCLTSCAKYSTAAGLCWSTEDFQFMSETVCGTATPSGTGGAPTSQGGSNSIGGGTGMGGLTFGTGGHIWPGRHVRRSRPTGDRRGSLRRQWCGRWRCHLNQRNGQLHRSCALWRRSRRNLADRFELHRRQPCGPDQRRPARGVQFNV